MRARAPQRRAAPAPHLVVVVERQGQQHRQQRVWDVARRARRVRLVHALACGGGGGRK
jgi:hypothetical protein